MAVTVYKSFPFLTVYWDDSFHGVLMEWKGSSQRGEQIKQGLDAGLELLIQKKSARWLANIKELSVFSQDTQDWINEDWFPRFLSSSATKMAVIAPVNFVAQLSVLAVMRTASGTNLNVQYFSGIEEARAWIMTSS